MIDPAATQVVDPPQASERPPAARHQRGAGQALRSHFSDSRWFSIFVVVAYVAVSVLANLNAWEHGVTHTVQTAAGAPDVQEEIWYLAQTPWAIVHGQNPLVNNFLNAPVGVNLMDNTAMPLLGLLGAPITFLLGPIATFNILLDVAFAGSAIAFYFMARRFVRWRPAAFVGGLVYGFSPFASAEGLTHLFLVFNVVPPLLVLCLDRYFRTKSDPAWLTGILVGGCFVAQLYISQEAFASMVVMTAIAAVVGVIYWAARRPKVELSQLARLGGCAIAVLALFGGIGLWTALEGPNHINGPEQSATILAGLSNDPAGLVVPTLIQRYTFGHAALGDSYVAVRHANWHIFFEAPIENGVYVGIPLLLILIGGVIALRRRRLVWLIALLAFAALLLSMGSYLHFNGHKTGVPLPFDVLSHLPLFDGSAASRYAEFFWLFAALLLVLVVDALYVYVDGWDRPGDRVRATAASGLVVVCALIPLIPAWPYQTTPANVPSWFTAGARSISPGTTVVVYPMASSVNSSAMLWQAMANMTFRMPGGYAVFSGPSGKATFVPAPSLFQMDFAQCATGLRVHVAPSVTRTLLRRWHASLAVIADTAPGQACASRIFTRAYGPPRHEGGVKIWHTG